MAKRILLVLLAAWSAAAVATADTKGSISPAVLMGFIPVVGSVHGGFGSDFKTSVQLLNANFTTIDGYFVFHPAGVSASSSDPTLGWTLQVGETASFDDIVSLMGASGLGSMDLFSADIAGPPIVVTRIFNDAGAAGTSGFTEPLVKPSDVSGGLGESVTGFLILPSDTTHFRYNIGIRTLDAPVSVTATVNDSAGNFVQSVTNTYAANFFEQKSVTDFMGSGFALADGESMQITFSGGGVIIYGATIDNVTQDPSAQFMPYVYAIA